MAVKGILVEEIHEKLTSKNTPYLMVVDTEGKKHNIFSELEDKFPLVYEARDTHRILKLTKEKKGEYWNVTGVELAEAPPEAPKSHSAPPKEESSAVGHKRSESGPETGKWWKEMGECFRSGLIDRNTPDGSKLWDIYYAKMLEVSGIEL
jgi:hypothetical protein